MRERERVQGLKMQDLERDLERDALGQIFHGESEA